MIAPEEKPLTEEDWQSIFLLRCRTLRGEELAREHADLCYRAFSEDPTRYIAMTSHMLETMRDQSDEATSNDSA
jgi:hypothetical protein